MDRLAYAIYCADQFLLDESPYINHMLHVLKILTEVGVTDVDTLMAGVLLPKSLRPCLIAREAAEDRKLQLRRNMETISNQAITVVLAEKCARLTLFLKEGEYDFGGYEYWCKAGA